jgi:hypothetical protein
VASFFSNHRPISVTSSVPLAAPEQVFQSIFASRKPSPKTKPGTAEVIYTLASTVQELDTSIARSQSQQQQQQQQTQDQNQLGQQERSDLISALTQSSHPSLPNGSEPQHLDGTPQQNISVHIPNGVKLAIQQIARQHRPFNPPPAPRPISDAQIEAEEAANALAAEEAEEDQARQLEQQIQEQDFFAQPQRATHSVYHGRRPRQANRFFTPHTAPMERDHPLPYTQPPQPNYHHIDGRGNGILQIDPRAGITDTLPRPSRPHDGFDRSGVSRRRRSPSRREEKLYAISVKRQRRLKMKKHKYKKLMRSTKTLRKKLGR